MTAQRPSALALSARPAAAYAAMGILWGSYSAQIPDIKAAIGADDSTFGTLVSLAALGLVLAMWVAPWVDRRLHRLTLPIATVGLGLAFLLPGLAPGPVTFALAMFGTALASGILDIVMNARVSEIEAANDRALMNFAHGVFSATYAVAAFSTGLARTAGWPPIQVFAVALIPVVILASQSVIASQDTDGEAGSRGKVPWWVVLPGGFIVLLAFMAEGATEVWSALHIERTLGGNALEGATGPALLGLTMAIGRFGGQAATQVMRESRLIALATGVAATGSVLAALAPTPLVAYAGFAILGLGISTIAPTALAMVGRRVGDGPRTKVIARTAVIGFSGFFIGPPLMGGLSEGYSLRVSFMVLAAVILATLLALAALMRMPKKG